MVLVKIKRNVWINPAQVKYVEGNDETVRIFMTDNSVEEVQRDFGETGEQLLERLVNSLTGVCSGLAS